VRGSPTSTTTSFAGADARACPRPPRSGRAGCRDAEAANTRPLPRLPGMLLPVAVPAAPVSRNPCPRRAGATRPKGPQPALRSPRARLLRNFRSPRQADHPRVRSACAPFTTMQPGALRHLVAAQGWPAICPPVERHQHGGGDLERGEPPGNVVPRQGNGRASGPTASGRPASPSTVERVVLLRARVVGRTGSDWSEPGETG
jgi:hypothetical protein